MATISFALEGIELIDKHSSNVRSIQSCASECA